MGLRGFLGCLLKIFNFFLLVSGVLMLCYSGWMYKEWATSHDPNLGSLSLSSSGNDDIWDQSIPWFIWATFGAGAFTVLVTLIGTCAAESYHICCLSCYQTGLIIMLLVQGTIAIFIFCDRNWERDLPDDPTGQERRTKDFVRNHFEFCKWGGLWLLFTQVFALILTLILKLYALNSANGGQDDIVASPQTNLSDPLLPQYNKPPNTSAAGPSYPQTADHPATSGSADTTSDAWRTRMVEKYGLDPKELAHNPDRAAQVVPKKSPDKNGCDIL